MGIREVWRGALARLRADRSVSISDPRAVELLSGGAYYPNYSGVEVTERTALALSAVFRAVALISGTVASLPLRTIRGTPVGQLQIKSFMDCPGGEYGLQPFSWKEMVLVHLTLHGNAYLAKVYNALGMVVGLEPIHPLCVNTRWSTRHERESGEVVGMKVHTATMIDGTVMRFDHRTMIHIMYITLDGLVGLSPIQVARNSLGTAIAGDRAAATLFNQGAMMSGIVTPSDEYLDEESGEVDKVREELRRNAGGWENAGQLAVVNRKLQFTPWSISAEDLQFLGSRQFQIEEIARWFGVPPHLLMQTEKQTSWGQGVESQNRAMGRTVLLPWTLRVEEPLSCLLPRGSWVEFDFSGLERPTPESEINLLIQQTNAGIITINEARRIRNLPPLPGGDVLRVAGVPIQGIPAQSPVDASVLSGTAGAEDLAVTGATV